MLKHTLITGTVYYIALLSFCTVQSGHVHIYYYFDVCLYTPWHHHMSHLNFQHYAGLHFSSNPRSDSSQLTSSFQYAFATVFAIISPTVYTSKIMNILLFIFFLKIKSSVKFSLDRKRNCIYWSIIKDTVAFSLYVLFRSGLSLNCSTYPTLHEPVPLNG